MKWPLAQRLVAVSALLAYCSRASLVDDYERCERVEPELRSTGGERLTAGASALSRLPAALTLSLAAFNRTFELELTVSTQLFADSFAATTSAAPAIGVASTTTQPPPSRLRTDCYYSGRMSGCNRCVAAFSLCDGQCVGFFALDGETYVVGPDGGSGGAHCIARESDAKRRRRPRQRPSRLRRRRQAGGARRGPAQPERSSAEAFAAGRPAGSDAATRFIELYLVMDRSLFRKHGAKTAARGVEIVNYASALLRPLNVYIVLVGLEVWSMSDRITISRDPASTLANFLYHRQYYISPSVRNDNAQLLIGGGVEFDDGVLGKAEIAGMCTRSRSGGVAVDSRESSLAAAATMAHELGHNLGLLHDERYFSTNDDAPFAEMYGPASAVQVSSGRRCSCSDPSGKCIMSGLLDSGTLPVTWSDCSKSHLAELFGAGGADACLKNMPTMLPGDLKHCGNYVVEQGEDCDCGPWGTCDNPCCDASTCRLKPGAVCSSGECCDLSKCAYVAAGRTCRPPANDDDDGSGCDLAEYCNGTSAQCPEDLHLRDGAPCSSNGGGGPSHCYRGRCRTRGSQCRKLWGDTGREASQACYATLNRLGSAQGHCGYDALYNIYTSCEPQHVECGLLQCEDRAEKLAYWQSASLSDSVRTVPVNGDASGRDVAYCRSVAMDTTSGIPNPAMVPDGAPCGNGGMCVAARCVPLAGVAEYGQCTAACNARGRCNNLGHCHCDVPYAPPNCSQPGSGGSVDSGPASSSADDGQAVGVPLIAGLVCGLPLAIVAAAFAYYYRDRIRRTCCERRSRRLPVGASAAVAAAEAMAACCRCLTVRYASAHGCARSSEPSAKAGKKLTRPAEGSANARTRQSLEISMPMLESTTNGLLEWDKEQTQAGAIGGSSATPADGSTSSKSTTPSSVRRGQLRSAATAADDIDDKSMAKRPLLQEQRSASGNLADKSGRALDSQQQQQLAKPTRRPLLPPTVIAARTQAAAIAAAGSKLPATLSSDNESTVKVRPARPPSFLGSGPGAPAASAAAAAGPTKQPQPIAAAAAAAAGNDPHKSAEVTAVVGASVPGCRSPTARLGSPAVSIRPSAAPAPQQQLLFHPPQLLLQHCESAPVLPQDSVVQTTSDKAARGVLAKFGCSPQLSGRAAFLQPPANNASAASASTAMKSSTPVVAKKPLAATSSVPVPAAAAPLAATVKRAPSLSSSKPSTVAGSAGTATAEAAVPAAAAASRTPAASASPKVGHKTAVAVCKNASPSASGDSGRTDGSPSSAGKAAAASSNCGSPSGRRPKHSSPGATRAAVQPAAGGAECSRPEVAGTVAAAVTKQQTQQPQYENVRTVAAARAAPVADNGLYDDVVLVPPRERQQSSRVT